MKARYFLRRVIFFHQACSFASALARSIRREGAFFIILSPFQQLHKGVRSFCLRPWSEALLSARAQSWRGLAEEQPAAYKDVNLVVDVVHRAGISKKVARMKPIGVIKG